MPNLKSAMKRVKVNKTKAAANKSRKTNLKTVLKNADAACANNAANKEEAIKVAIKELQMPTSEVDKRQKLSFSSLWLLRNELLGRFFC